MREVCTVLTPRAAISVGVWWVSYFAVVSGGITGLTIMANHMSAAAPTQISLSRASWGFVSYWAALVLLAVIITIPAIPAKARRTVAFFNTIYSDSDRAGLASILGPATRWKRRLLLLSTTASIIGLSALMSTVWGSTASGLWNAFTVSDEPARVFPHLSSVWPAMFWWMVLSGGVIWICVRALGFGLVTMPARFSYRVRTARLPLAVTTGARSGLNFLANFVQIAPALLLAYVAISANPSSDLLASHVLPQWLHEAASNGVRAIAFRPAVSAVLLGAIPLILLVILYRALEPWSNLDANDWSLATDIAPVLYLRTWEADRVKLSSNGLRFGALEHLAPPRGISLADVIGTSLASMAPVIATAEPGGRRLSNVGSMWSGSGDWRENVRIRAADALCVVLTADSIVPETGFSWEVEMIGRGEVTDRVVLVLPPGMTVSGAQKPGGFLYEVALLPVFRGLGLAGLPEDSRVLVREAGGDWRPYQSSIDTDLSYYLCVMDAVEGRRDDWELDARPATGHKPDGGTGVLGSVSRDRFAREASMDGGLLGVQRMRQFHWFVSSKWGKRYTSWLETLR